MGTIASVVLHWYETTRSPRRRNESFDIFESPRPPSVQDEQSSFNAPCSSDSPLLGEKNNA